MLRSSAPVLADHPFGEVHAVGKGARAVMEEEWREKPTGHRSRRVGRAHRGYAELKAKVDLVRFGLETG
ncbi:MAG: hypothetical protein ICV73_23670 [Acetobacteraceae bacterium]|nr:hypothetical protein [Acetobacteraceae bacterium]